MLMERCFESMRADIQVFVVRNDLVGGLFVLVHDCVECTFPFVGSKVGCKNVRVYVPVCFVSDVCN